MSVVHEISDSSVLAGGLSREQLGMTIEAYYSDVITYLRHKYFRENPEIAEDVAQETFEKVINKYETYRGEGDLKAWIITIASHAACDYLRKKRNTHELPTEAHLLERPGTDDQALLLDHLAFEGLVEKSAFSILRLLANGWSYEDISIAQGIKINTLKARVRRTRLALRQLIGEQPELLN